jgi:hypothetical protein
MVLEEVEAREVSKGNASGSDFKHDERLPAGQLISIRV